MPLAVTFPPPSEVTFPPDVAVVAVITDAKVVVIIGRLARVVNEVSLPYDVPALLVA
jgi:hypothetical protein